MSRRAPFPVSLLVGTLALAACAPLPSSFALSRANPDLDDAPERRPAPTHFLAWAAEAPFFIIVDKPSRTLELYRFGEREKVYEVVLGRNQGRKLYEGDRRTPAGVYKILTKRNHSRFHRFLDIDYPNAVDLTVYRESLREGLIPKRGGQPVSPGTLVGIHGTEDEALTRVGLNWTYGCIALANPDIDELYAIVPEGTPVLIRDGQSP